MRLTLNVELNEREQCRSSHIKKIMEELHPTVDTRFVLDKNVLTERLFEATKSRQYDAILRELKDRLSHPTYGADYVEAVCAELFFSSSLAEGGQIRAPAMCMVAQLPEEKREAVKRTILSKAMSILSSPRRQDCSRLPLLSCAETLILMVKAELLPLRSLLDTLTKMIRFESTRTAGITCLGKLVEELFDMIRSCDGPLLSALCHALIDAYHGNTFLYDVEYIMEAFGWSTSRSPMSLKSSSTHHQSPILAMQYYGGVNKREFVVSSSTDGCIATWDANGGLLENTALSRCYASSLDLMNGGNTLLVGTAGRLSSSPPALILYQREGGTSEWVESKTLEPAGVEDITGVRGFHSNLDFNFCASAHMLDGRDSLLLFDQHQEVIGEYHDHRDIITSIHAPSESSHAVITGSRDAMVCLYDTRISTPPITFTKHKNTVTAIATVGDLLFTGGLDGLVVIQDMRVSGIVATYELDSAVLALAINSGLQCAVSTLTGIHLTTSSIGFSNSTFPSFERVNCGSLAPRYNALAWNAGGTFLYAGGDSCTLDRYHRSEESEHFASS